MSLKRRRASKRAVPFIVVSIVLLCSSGRIFVSSYKVCDDSEEAGADDGDGICPDGNTCCRMSDGGTGCIPGDVDNNLMGTCCPDGRTGCAPGYACSNGSGSDYLRRGEGPDERDGLRPRCVATAPWAARDPLVRVMPRYVLCHPPGESLTTVYGLSIDGVVAPDDTRLAYYSSGGDIQLDHERDHHMNITMALIVIHGANRNADDYFCSATAAVSLQSTYPPDSVLVLAPRFLVPSDGPVNLTTSSTSLAGKTTPLRWADEGAGPWRYGAPAVYPPHATNVSSFRAVDQILAELGNSTRFPSLRRITVTGHSSGGQFVQRWSLMTSSWSSDHPGHHQNRRLDGEDSSNEDERRRRQRRRGLQIVAVVANPSSYAYLTPERFWGGSWRVPPSASSKCPTYDGWEWGLNRSAAATGSKYHVKYVDEALEGLGDNATALAERFASRSVYYLSGGSDRCNVSGTEGSDGGGGWCNSHGLETTCMDEMQGSNRLERCERYFASLARSAIVTTNHRRLVVPGVGHDHTLMFTSDAGLFALFGDSSAYEVLVSSNTG